MPKFNDPALDQQKKDLGAQIDTLEQQIANAPDEQDTSDLEAQLEQLEQQMKDVQDQRKAYRDQKRDEWKASKGKQ